jgi:hypothetical protein
VLEPSHLQWWPLAVQYLSSPFLRVL